MKIIVKALCYLLCLSSFIANAQEAGVTRYGEVSTVKNKEYIDQYGRISPCPQLTRYGKIIRYTANMDTLLYGLNGAGALTVSIHVTSVENADSVGFECATDQNFTDIVALKNHISVDTITYKDTFNTLTPSGTYYLRAYIANCPGVVYCDTVKIEFDTITFMANGGSGTMAQQITLRGMKTVLASNVYTHAGYFTFANWSDTPDEHFESLTYSDKDTIVTNGNITLYAQWGNYCTGIPYETNETGDGKITSVKDHEDNWYKVVQIGSQCWLQENMRCVSGPTYGAFTSYNATTHTTTASAFNSPSIFANDCGTCTRINGDVNQRNEKGDADFIQKYGYLYTWEAAADIHDHANKQPTPLQGICPEGWHLPTYNEYTTMFNYVKTSLLGQTNAASPNWTTSSSDNPNGTNTNIAVALAGGSDWRSSTTNGSAGDLNNPLRNISGFTALPAHDYNTGKFWAVTTHAIFWTATNNANGAASWYLDYNSKGLFYNNATLYLKNQVARSVRCVRDN